jgi:hypothetical protein
VSSAQEAAEASRQSASLAEQAGKRSDFAAEASMLLERLETDYSLLTRLVQELHSRISGLSAISLAPPAPVYEPEPVYEPMAEEAPVYEAEPPIEAYEPELEPAPSWGEPEVVRIEQQPVPEMIEPEPLQAYAPQPAPTPSWNEPEVVRIEQQPVPEMVEPEPLQAYAPEPVDALSPSSWPMRPPVDFDTAPAIVASEPAFEAAPVSSFSEPVADVAPDVSVSATPSITIFGRVQITISPVPDFDKLLSLDSALARIPGVHSVTLADYAREEVVFRVELEKPVSVVEFAHQLSETAGVPTEVTEASENTLSIHIG